MCLYTKMEIRKADKDIVCYKRVVKTVRGYETPYRHAVIPPECLKSEMEYTAAGEIDIKASDFQNEVRGGMIHTYGYKNSAISLMFPNEEVWVCVIPKGTEYVWGVDNINESSYASKSIRFLNMVCW